MTRTPLIFAAVISNLLVATAFAATVDEASAGMIESK